MYFSSLAKHGLAYVIAFEEDGTAKDVTRRYAKAYNSKTRRMRVDGIPDTISNSVAAMPGTGNGLQAGDKWLRSALKPYRRRLATDVDQIEDTELRAAEAREPMPRNVADFKDHPVYVLERHLRANEVLEPKREVGKFGATSGKNTKVESVYRRQDVHLCRSADGWYRRGRDIEDSEQPLKRLTPKTRSDRDADAYDVDEDGAADASDGPGAGW